MAIYFTDFSEYTTGVQPSDWTERWVTTDSTWTKEDDGGTGALGGARLQHVATVDGRRLLSWDDIDADADRDNSEVLARVRSNSTSAAQNTIVIRGSGAAGSENGYQIRFRDGTALDLFKLVAGVATQIGTDIPFTWIAQKWYWVRFRVNGSDLKIKVWDGDHEQEPAAWNRETTDTAITGDGWVGFGAFESTGTRSYDDIAIGTNGDTAAFPTSDDVRVTQTPVLVLSAADSDVRVTQAAVLVLGELTDAAPTRITQVATLALVGFDAGIRVTQTAVLVLADQVNCLTKWAQTWTITRTDGEVFAFTSHDMSITFRGVVHSPCNSIMATAVELSTAMGTSGNQDLTGLLSDVGITEADIYNGLYDGATIESWMVPWENSGGEIPFRLMGGVIGSAGFGELTHNQEILSDSARLQQTALLETYTPGCRYKFGNVNDSRCPVNLSALQVSGSVTGTAIPNASTSATRRIFTDSTRAEADGYFNLGVVTWTSGQNVGAQSEIKDFTSDQFVLWEALLFPIAIGDTYTATPGCDKSTADHLVFNADLVDFGGFPDVPGNDSILQSPDAKG